VPAPTPDLLRRYEGTIAALADNMPALLPVRFGTCIETAEELVQVLRARRSAFQAALARVRHRAQMTVRVLRQGVRNAPGEAGQGEPPARQRQVAAAGRRAGTGAAYLHARAVAVARAREVAGFAPVRAAVSRWVRDERVEKRAGIATVYHLVPRASVSRYRDAVTRAAAAAGLQVIVTGPWAPYAFAAW
jgi:hypothetical protein